MTATLFNVAGLAIVGWALMIFLPGWSVTKRLVEWALFPVALAVVYVIGIIVVLGQTGLGVVADFGSAEGVVGLMREADVALVAWIHLLVFDHLIAVLIFRDNAAHGVVPLPVQSVLLLLVLMLGPVGFLTYWGVRVARGHGPALGGALSVEAT